MRLSSARATVKLRLGGFELGFYAGNLLAQLTDALSLNDNLTGNLLATGLINIGLLRHHLQSHGIPKLAGLEQVWVELNRLIAIRPPPLRCGPPREADNTPSQAEADCVRLTYCKAEPAIR